MLIAIEGCVGIGKTTVARGLARVRESECLMEDFESNPFLTEFYADPVASAIETEFSFLLLHFHQLRKTNPGAETISDFHIWKDSLYAALNLREADIQRAFQSLYELLWQRVPAPSLMVFLSGSDRLILDRIANRRREPELRADPQYFARLNEEYERAIRSYADPKLVVPMEQWDFVANPDLFPKLSQRINDELKRLNVDFTLH